MSLGQYLRDIADGYLRSSIHSVGHGLLAQAGDRLIPLLAAGLKVEGSGGKGVATFTPWIGIFDPDETDNPKRASMSCISTRLRLIGLCSLSTKV
jgi:hypothetical protein